MGAMEFGAAIAAAGFGFVLADGLDRFLATYNPAGAKKPTDKFTSDGAGTLANTLNVASKPNWMRLAAGAGTTVVPAFASMYVRNPLVKSSLEGAAIGAGVKLFSLVWNNLLMPMFKPKDVVSLQKSYIARLYPAEIAASINMAAQQTAVPTGTSFGALSGSQDVGPFALAGSSPYPDAAQALRAQAGVQGPGGDYPTMQNVWGTGMNSTPGYPGVSDYPTAAQAMSGMAAPPSASAGVPYAPGPPPGPGPGPQANPHTDPACGCIGDPTIGYAAFLGETESAS